MEMGTATWIWTRENAGADEFGEFVQTFTSSGRQTVCRISCDGDYTLWINGAYAASNQYGDYPARKCVDTVDITPHLRVGKNVLAVLCWHFGAPSQRYIPAPAGLLFTVEEEGQEVASSGAHTLGRVSRAYRSGACKIVTRQLGFSFCYDATAEDDWQNGNGAGFVNSVAVHKPTVLVPRPVKKLRVDAPCGYDARKDPPLPEQANFVIDLQSEQVGLPQFRLWSPAVQTVTVAWGEHLQNGHVLRVTPDGSRDFSFTYIAKEGHNDFTHYMLRLGCRYLEITCERPVRLLTAGILPQRYPVRTRAFTPVCEGSVEEKALDKRIYDVCVRTLKLCMLEHYVDCPWREQNLYVFDARNQMLCGYDAFEGGNAAYARANLALMAQGLREDGLLPICFPCGSDLPIPSFSLYYAIAVNEYIRYTGDASLGAEVLPVLDTIVQAFVRNAKGDLACKFGNDIYWNFYDWSEGAEGSLRGAQSGEPDLLAGCLFVWALRSLREICAAAGVPYAYAAQEEKTRNATREWFFRRSSELYTCSLGGGDSTELGNALALLSGVATEEQADRICACLVQKKLPACSLAMKTLTYDALLARDEKKYAPFVLGEIRAAYGKMLREDATSVWETEEGAAAFGFAGSLCHGWSAIPVHYYHRLSKR